MTEERLEQLEIKIAYQEDLLQDLNALVAGQQMKIDQLEASLKVLNEKLRELSSSTSTHMIADERPPHY
ncbi:MAG: SlyX family protein [Gammaproteobacteria bacterium]|nr:SlyX family protein [Gammaproteobacteria bacterium]